ncbi:hypothetical protein Ddye_023938 [Dipteronia dyeriana]|uniref:Uncharacterized protein n=1 Tax=Dipteronia dyeriana TaxID=168575 RepID=A0AAD9TUU3_9ROSI|nr:hypothetical protein Ddye_023938 [Dipteronia dyeriana]
MPSQSEDSLSFSLARIVEEYQGDPSKVDLDSTDSTSDSDHHNGVTGFTPRTDLSICEVGINLPKSMAVGRLKTSSELSMEPPSTSKSEARLFLSDNPKHDTDCGRYLITFQHHRGHLISEAFQTQFFFKKDVKSLSKKVISLTSFNTKMKKKIEEARFADVVAKEAMKEASGKLAGLEEEVARLRASLKWNVDKLFKTDATLTDALERFNKVTDEAIIQTQDDDEYEDNNRGAGDELEKEAVRSNAGDNLEGLTHV